MTFDHTDRQLPGIDALKAQAKRLRSAMLEQGTPLTHAMALEATARQWGCRDWNTLCALAKSQGAPAWHVGQRVEGRYLGHRFAGRLKSVRATQAEYWYLTVVFDEAVDVVASAGFSAFRKQVNVCITANGTTQEKTSDGLPHMELRAV